MVPSHALLGGAIDLDLGGVQVDRWACGDQRAPLPGSQQPGRPGDQHPDRLLDPGDLPVAEAARQRRGRGRRRRRKAAQPRASPIGALVVAVDQEVPTGQQRLGQPHQQLPRAKPAAAPFDRAHHPVNDADHAKGADRLGDHHQARRRGQAGIVGAQLEPPAALSYRLHPAGAFRSGASVGLGNPDSL
jgi:hypothetical protein